MGFYPLQHGFLSLPDAASPAEAAGPGGGTYLSCDLVGVQPSLDLSPVELDAVAKLAVRDLVGKAEMIDVF
jgi:hypothetical protein